MGEARHEKNGIPHILRLRSVVRFTQREVVEGHEILFVSEFSEISLSSSAQVKEVMHTELQGQQGTKGRRYRHQC